VHLRRSSSRTGRSIRSGSTPNSTRGRHSCLYPASR
jgi:hypothetical protein